MAEVVSIGVADDTASTGVGVGITGSVGVGLFTGMGVSLATETMSLSTVTALVSADGDATTLSFSSVGDETGTHVVAGVPVGADAGVGMGWCYAGVGSHKCMGLRSSGDTEWEH